VISTSQTTRPFEELSCDVGGRHIDTTTTIDILAVVPEYVPPPFAAHWRDGAGRETATRSVAFVNNGVFE
jgi:hypothetical protein